MKTTITQADLELAVAAHARTERLSESCLVFQVAKRCGLPVAQVGYDFIRLESFKDVLLSGEAQRLTKARCSEWPDWVGKGIELPDVATEVTP